MARSLPRRLAHAAYWALPRRAQTTIRSAFGPALLRRRLRGVAAPTAREPDRRRPVSIVIPSYDDAHYLAPLLASLRATCEGRDYEVIIVDDHATEHSRSRLRPFEGDRVRVLTRETRGGFAKAVNTGLAAARHDVVLLNSDTVALPGWLDALQSAALDTDPRIGMVSGMLVYPDGLVQYGGTYHTRTTYPQWFGHLWAGSAADRPAANVGAYIRAISGACVYVRRELLDLIGGLDEDYWLGFEDVDWGMRAWRAGWRCWYEPSAKLVHHESATRGYSQGRRELASMRLFWRKWSRAAGKEPLPSAVALLASELSPWLWCAWAQALAGALARHGIAVEVITVGADEANDEIVDRLGSSTFPIVMDAGAVRTGWLVAEKHGSGLYLLDGRAVARVDDAAQIRASWRPEFDFIAPGARVARRFVDTTSWPTIATVAPTIPARGDGSPPSTRRAVVAVGPVPPSAEAALRRAAGSELTLLGAEAIDDALLDAVAALRPRVVVSFLTFEDGLEPAALSGLGGAFLARSLDGPRGALDGLTALLVDPDDASATSEAITMMLEHDDVVDELEANARRAIAHDLKVGPAAVLRAIAAAREGGWPSVGSDTIAL